MSRGARWRAAKSRRLCAERYIKAHRADWKQRSARVAVRSTRSGTCCNPGFGSMAVQAVDTGSCSGARADVDGEACDRRTGFMAALNAVLDSAAARGYTRATPWPGVALAMMVWCVVQVRCGRRGRLAAWHAGRLKTELDRLDRPGAD